MNKRATRQWIALPVLAPCLALCLVLSGCGADGSLEEEDGGAALACPERVLNVGFYADFVPISYSEDNQAPTNSESYNTHRGYDADLLTALEALQSAGLSFSRRGIPPVETQAGRSFPFNGIWLLATEPEYDLISGGVTIRSTASGCWPPSRNTT